MAFVYILRDEDTEKFYIGSCSDLQRRLEQHSEGISSRAFTLRFRKWYLFYSVSNLSYKEARSIEAHIKRMKSRDYIENLKQYPEITEKLRIKYQN